LWNSLGLGQLGYDGLFVEAKAMNEFSNNLFVDVLPTLTGSDNKVTLHRSLVQRDTHSTLIQISLLQ